MNIIDFLSLILLFNNLLSEAKHQKFEISQENDKYLEMGQILEQLTFFKNIVLTQKQEIEDLKWKYQVIYFFLISTIATSKLKHGLHN